MMNILLFLFFIACAGIATSLMVESSGSVTMLWFDYQIETSVAFLLISIVLTAIVIVLITLIVRGIISAPANFWKKRNVKQLKLGISELTYGVAALAASNIDAAEAHVKKVEKLLGRTPLTLLLSAQIAKTRGDELKTQVLLEQLLEYKETEYLAARSLSDNASKLDNLPKALHLAQKAQMINPKDNASALAVISLEVRLGRWHEALHHLQNSKLARKEKKRVQALIQLARGELLLEEGHHEQALYLARNVISVLPDFVPAVSFVANAYSVNDRQHKAINLLVKAWKNNPSKLIVDTLNNMILYEPPERRKKLLSLLTGNADDGIWKCKTCTHSQKIWNIHCDSCHEFDGLEWNSSI